MQIPVTHRPFRNWYESIECWPEYSYRPRNEQEVVEIVREAYGSGRVVRAFGAGHSWSPLVPTDGILINLDAMDDLLHVDHDRQQVTVQAGMRIAQLNEILYKCGLAMRNLGSISEQSIAGAIATATHGTGAEHPILSQYIVGAELVGGDGQIHRFSADAHPDEMAAVRVHLGALGILTRVTIQCEKKFNLQLDAELLSFEQVLNDQENGLDNLIKVNDRVRLYWFAHTPDMYVMKLNPTDKLPKVGNTIVSWIENVALQRYALGFLLNAGYQLRALDLVDEINQFAARFGFDEKHQVDRSDRLLNVPMPTKHNECEYAIPVENAKDALRQIRELIMSKHLNANMPVEVRFAKEDNIWLSPAYDRDVCYIGAYTEGDDFEQEYFAAFEPLMKQFGGRPHWGKYFSVTAEELREMYPRYDAFNKIRKRLDPTGTFANQLIRDLFG